MAKNGKVSAGRQKQMLADLRKETRAMAPIVRRVLARHGAAGRKVFVKLPGETKGAWVQVSKSGMVKETLQAEVRKAPPRSKAARKVAR